MECDYSLSHNNEQLIIVADNEADVREYLETALRCRGYVVESVQDGKQAVDCVYRNNSHVRAVLLDMGLQRQNGLEALRQIRQYNRDVPVILLSCTSSVHDIVEAMKNGATDCLEKPISREHLESAVTKALSQTRSTSGASRSVPLERAGTHEKPVGHLPWIPMRDIDSILPSVASSDVPVLIQGETGVGKEVMARRIHLQSGRGDQPFLKLNCAALPAELVESELFGYERGAFTGAFQRKLGIFEMADRGTLLLDEIGDMSFRLQSKLLHVLQDKEFHRLGGRDLVRTDVRIIAATHCDLKAAMETKRFRDDLYYRLNVISIHIPPLRERKSEIARLADFLVNKHANGGTPMSLSAELQQALVEYHWPGNIRELENVVCRLLVLRNEKDVIRELREETLRLYASVGPATQRNSNDGRRLPLLEQVNEAKRHAERSAIVAALEQTKWNRKEAAVLLKLDYKALLYKMKKQGISHGRNGTNAAMSVLKAAAGL